ncbi:MULTISPECIES: MerR family transcriptional regulator [Kordiimonas]|uniref:DNA-binding transcriptional regulator, MerR family n=1 Tax=Kordiimonas lacus TaxID=637679 RepID=A0A1G6W800_9PROT|nr:MULTISPECIES: MerR family transcriptional regulator [Kordiimonas]SDD61186.1 DNA-binding transcriptional regulator, MerR family [Kordiimonas lacus]
MSETASGLDRPRGGKGREAFRTISEVADELDLPQHVLRFWESKFTQVKPLKRGGNRRYYRPDDVTLLKAIKKLLHSDGYTIRGVQKLFKAQGLKATIFEALEMVDDGAVEAAPEAAAEVTEVASDVQAPAADGAQDSAALRDVLDRLKALRARLS